MARPQKNGLDYFPLDVDIDQDDKIALIESQYGIEGFGIVIKLLMKIYKTSYFYEWTEREQLLFSKRVNVDINRVNVIINDCIKWGLFSNDVFISYKILTSKGIQKRYLEAVGRRQKVEMYKEYLLLDNEIINVYKNLVIVNINPTQCELMPTLIPKEKESKVKESRVEERRESSLPPTPLSIPTPLHREILNNTSELIYKTWFMNSEIAESENKVIIYTAYEFTKNVIESKFLSELNRIFNKEIVVQVKEGEDVN